MGETCKQSDNPVMTYGMRNVAKLKIVRNFSDLEQAFVGGMGPVLSLPKIWREQKERKMKSEHESGF